MIDKMEEIVLRGLPISRGIGIGQPLFFFHGEEDIPEVSIPSSGIDAEIERYRRALSLSREDVERLQRLSLNDGPPEIVNILGTHLEMLQDPLMTSGMEEKIRKAGKNPESIVLDVISEYKKRFRSIKDGYFQERIRDIIDVSRRVLGHLFPMQRMRLGTVPPGSIILAHDLVPSDTVEATMHIGAFVTASGGITSHAAIIARAKGIPYVAHVDIKLFRRFDKIHGVIVDGSQGIVIVNPTPDTLIRYRILKKGQLQNFRLMQNAVHLRGETIDGYRVRIFANLEGTGQIDYVLKHGAAGVGLVRTEYLLFPRKRFPSEDVQTAVYKKMTERLGKNRPLIIRLFDIGGDKKLDFGSSSVDSHYFRAIGHEPNPALGCRAIRFLMRFSNLLDSQLRAILRASAFGNIHILIPMVSDISELRYVRSRIAKLSRDLRRQGFKIPRSIPVGCMIEVPSSALLCDELAKTADFLSVGTNDLVQYVLASDRWNNDLTAHFYTPAHPSILRLLRMIIASANRFKKPLLLCGESASDPLLIPLLLGLGIRDFSVAARSIPFVKHVIRKWRILDACQLAEQALEYACAEDLKRFLEERVASLEM